MRSICVSICVVIGMACPHMETVGGLVGIMIRNSVRRVGGAIMGMEAIPGMNMADIVVGGGMGCNRDVSYRLRTSSKYFWRNWRTGPRMATSSLSRWKTTLTVSTFPAPA